jgi:hypothetical protein
MNCVTKTEGNIASETSRNYDVNLKNDGDDSDGYDGSRGSAHDNNDTNVMVVTAPNQQET